MKPVLSVSYSSGRWEARFGACAAYDYAPSPRFYGDSAREATRKALRDIELSPDQVIIHVHQR